MLFEDNILYMDDLDEVEKSPICIAVPLKTHISLKDIWIPSELLINRKIALDSNRNRPNIYHTLYKPDAESFSVYSEDTNESTENEYFQAFDLSNSYENNVSSISNTDQTNSPKTCFSSEDENSERELKLFLELLNESPPHESKTECHDTEKFANLMDTKHIEKQNEVENQEQCALVLDTLNSESKITIQNETECHDKEKSEIFLHTLNSKCLLCKDRSLDSVCHNKEKIEDLDVLNVKKQNLDDNSDNTVDIKKICDNSLTSCSTQSVLEHPVADQKHSFQDPPTKREKKTKNKSHNKEKFENMDAVNIEKQNIDENSDNTVSVMETCDNSLHCSSQAMIELPVAYQKHSFQDPPIKQKNQKEKKKKNTVNKNIQLGDFFQTVNSDSYEIPNRDEFYENLVRRGICVPQDLPEREFYGSHSQDSFIEDFTEKTNFLSSSACATPLFEYIENVQSCGAEELEDETLTTTLVLENISSKVSESTVKDFMSFYGKLKNISFIPDGKYFKAYVKLVVEHEVEWVIDCLNESEPFGESREKVKCYELQE